MEGKKISKSKILIAFFALILIVCVAFIGKLAEDVPNEKIVVNQFPLTGTIEYWTEAGLKWQGGGKTTDYFKTQQFWFGGKDANGVEQGNPIKVIFNDASVGYIHGSLRIKLPLSENKLKLIHTDYNGMDRLMNDLVSQTVVKVVYASGTLMSAFESYAEKKNDLIAYVDDQLCNGVYKTRINEIVTIDSFTGEEKKIKVASLIPNENSAGGFERSESSPFAYYGIEIGQVSISEIRYDERVTKQIETQQQANMSIQTKKSEAMAAQQDAIKAEAEGKAAAAKAKWEQERVKATEVTKAEQEREVARLNAERAEFDKKRVIAEGQAEAEANRLKVAAGLTPQERAEWDYKTKVGVAQAMSQIALPRIISLGGANGQSSAMDAMGLKMMKSLVDEMSE